MHVVRRSGSAIGAMSAGLALTVVALIVAHVGHAPGDGLARHVRAGYPTYTRAHVDTAVATYLVHLSIGALGIFCRLARFGPASRGPVEPRP
jgi:hypothetical protein